MASVTIFHVNGERYALPTVGVREVLPVSRITRIPRTAAALLGVTNVRGRVVPVVDLRRRLGFAQGEPGHESRMVLVQHADEEAGLLVDGVEGVFTMQDENLGQNPVAGGGDEGMIRGLFRLEDETVVMMLNAGPILLLGRRLGDRGAQV